MHYDLKNMYIFAFLRKKKYFFSPGCNFTGNYPTNREKVKQ